MTDCLLCTLFSVDNYNVGVFMTIVMQILQMLRTSYQGSASVADADTKKSLASIWMAY